MIAIAGLKCIVSGKYIQPVQFRGANCRHTIIVLLIAIPDWVIQMSRLPWFCRCCQREIRKEDPTLTKHNFILEKINDFEKPEEVGHIHGSNHTSLPYTEIGTLPSAENWFCVIYFSGSCKFHYRKPTWKLALHGQTAIFSMAPCCLS